MKSAKHVWAIFRIITYQYNYLLHGDEENDLPYSPPTLHILVDNTDPSRSQTSWNLRFQTAIPTP
jgi:hypothetical protein